jgi:hypothetical protein
MMNGMRNTRDRAGWKTWVKRVRLSRALIAGAVVALSGVAIAQGPVSGGRLIVWGTVSALTPPPGSGDFVALAAAGGAQTLAIRSDGKLYLSSASGGIPAIEGTSLATDEFCGVGMGRNHLLAIRPDGSIAVWGFWGAVPATAPDETGPFVAVSGGGSHSVALDTNGRVVVWGTDAAAVGAGAPAGITFKAIAAKGRYTLALSSDGNIYGWGTDQLPQPGSPAPPGIVKDVFKVAWTPYETHYFIAPLEAGNPYTAMAAGLDLVAGLRADGTVIVWDATGKMQPTPAGIVFTQVAAGSEFAAGIDQTGYLHAWGNPLRRAAIISGVPDGVHSAISAANAHITAIAGQPDTTPPVVTGLQVDQDTLWAPNHKMRTVALTFRASDCSPVALAGLSVTLRSNQPDNDWGSGDTTGDTNGHDGHTSDVQVPAGALVQNADGSVTATFQVRAERSNDLLGTRIYTVSVTATDTASSPNTSAPMTAQIVVGNGG